MFRSSDVQFFTRCPLRALSAVRSFLLLEDDYGVKWELDHDESSAIRPGRWEAAWEEPDRSPMGRRVDIGEDVRKGPESGDGGPQAGAGCGEHPHRVVLRRSPRERRPGVVAPREQICLCPVPKRPSGAQDAGSRSRASTGG